MRDWIADALLRNRLPNCMGKTPGRAGRLLATMAPALAPVAPVTAFATPELLPVSVRADTNFAAVVGVIRAGVLTPT